MARTSPQASQVVGHLLSRDFERIGQVGGIGRRFGQKEKHLRPGLVGYRIAKTGKVFHATMVQKFLYGSESTVVPMTD